MVYNNYLNGQVVSINIKLMVYNNYLNGQVVSINIKLSREKSITIYDFLFMIHDTFTNTDFKL